MAENSVLREENASLQRQLDWFKRQLFGRKSERLLAIDPAVQQSLLGSMQDLPAPPPPEPDEDASPAKTPSRKTRRDAVNDTGLRFDASVPVKVIEVAPDLPEGMSLDDVEVIATRSTFRLAQRRASYEILEYRCPVIKVSAESAPQATPAPATLFDGSLADVSFIAGMLVDKFCYHLPLYRQHQRLQQAGIPLSRTTLTQQVARAAALLSPIHVAQLEHVLKSAVLAMDETPIKAGRKAKGKMKEAWFWPLYGDHDEISFTFSPSRAKAHIDTVLGDHFEGVLLTDGNASYARYAEKRPGVTHAECWAHARRHFEKARGSDDAVEEGLLRIAGLYKAETWIREKGREGPEKLKARTDYSEPRVRAFWQWCDHQLHRDDLEPRHPLRKAVEYALKRQRSLEVFLSDPDVPIDTNHLERGLRCIPMGRRNWLFCWSEVGAEHVGIVQSLLTTCRLQGVDPYTYLVDVLQRVALHPASRVDELTPRRWKTLFADAPLRSDIER
ncbi:IS66 family transposase [Halomonas sp. PGE1]|nr:IS66 family transposase [Halomonas sp. PGE1]